MVLKRFGTVSGASLVAVAGLFAQDVPDVLYTPHEQFYGDHAQAGNLLNEGTSFEVGATGALDGGWYWREVRSYARSSMSGTLGDLLTTHEPPQVVTDSAAPHGDRCVQLQLRSGSSQTLLSRPFKTAPSSGGPVDHRMRCSIKGQSGISTRAAVTIRIETFPDGASVSPRIDHIPTDNWVTRIAGPIPLQPDTWYRVKVVFGNKDDTAAGRPDQWVRLDAFSVREGSSLYNHPTDGWEIGARVKRQSDSARALYDTFWQQEDGPGNDKQVAIDLYRGGTITGPAHYEVYLYDSAGTPGNPATAVASTGLSPIGLAAHQTTTLSLEPMMAAAGGHLGFYLIDTLLIDGDQQVIDRQQTPFLYLKKAPDLIPAPQDSPFGTHPHLLTVGPTHPDQGDLNFWALASPVLTASVEESLGYLRALGYRRTREFGLFSYTAWRYYPGGDDDCGSGACYDWMHGHLANVAQPAEEHVPIYFTEYADLLQQLGMGTIGSLHAAHGYPRAGTYPSEAVDPYYDDYVAGMTSAFGRYPMMTAEVMNEMDQVNENVPIAIGADAYAAWLRLSRATVDAAGPSGFALAAPVPTWILSEWIQGVLDAVHDSHLGYQDIDVFTYHRYTHRRPFDPGSTPHPWFYTLRGTEDAFHNGYGPVCYEWEMIDVAGIDSPRDHLPITKPPSLGGGPIDLPKWNSEWAGSHPVCRSDQPFVTNHKDSEGDVTLVHMEGMSGSLTLGRKNAAREMRHQLLSLAWGTTHLSYFVGLGGDLNDRFRMFERDNTPTVTPAAQSHLANQIEGFDCAGEFQKGQLSDNGVNEHFTRALLFVERTKNDPRAVAVLWNWAEEEIDTDGIDPPASSSPTVIPLIDISPSSVVVTDLMGRVSTFGGSTITDFVLTAEPQYIRTQPGVTPQQLAQALDLDWNSTAPTAPQATVFGHQVLVEGSEDYGDDVERVLLRRTLPGGKDVEVYRGPSSTFVDQVGPGTYSYRFRYEEHLTGRVAISPYTPGIWVF